LSESERRLRLRTNEQHEAARALEKLRRELEDVRAGDPYAWKWALIALHNAMQNMMVSTLAGSAGLGVLTEKTRRKWLEAYERRSGCYPEEKLDFFLSLYERLKCEAEFAATPDVNEAVRWLNAHRNDFIHFLPRAYVLLLYGLPETAGDCLSVVRCVGWEHDEVPFWNDAEDEALARRELDACLRLLLELAQDYEQAVRDLGGSSEA
jgi:hypothetical protein